MMNHQSDAEAGKYYGNCQRIANSLQSRIAMQEDMILRTGTLLAQWQKDADHTAE